MEQSNHAAPAARPAACKRVRWLILLVVVLAAVAVLGAVARQKLGYRSIPHTRIALRSPAATSATQVSIAVAAEDWPRWRGPRGDGISRETEIAVPFPAGGPPQLWSADVGIGYSSPVAAAGRVYLFTLNERKETLTAFDAPTGRILWGDESSGGNWTGSYPGTRATPAIDGDSIYTYGGAGELTRHDLATGRPRWRLNVLTTTGSGNLGWGTASSPLVTADAVYVQSGKGGAIAVAVRKDDGSVLWQSEASGVGGYAHPILIEVAGRPQLIVFGGKAVYAMDPATGKTLWQQPWETNYDVNSTTPVYRDGHLFVSSEYDHGSMMLRVSAGAGGAPTAEKLWESKEIQGKFPGMILDGDALYANSAGTIKCMSWPDGKILWAAADPKLRLGMGGSIVRFGGDKLLAMSDRGKLTLARATPQSIEPLAQAQVLDGREIWSTPLLYAGRLYAKGDTEFVCFDLTGAPASRPSPATQPPAARAD
jgi:outer membrane protein assembly factor BamB